MITSHDDQPTENSRSDCRECPGFQADSEYHLAQHYSDSHGQHDLLDRMDQHEAENPRQ